MSNTKHPIETSEVTILAVRCRKSSTGKPLVFMQAQTHPDAAIGYVRCTTPTPPLPGTRVIVTGPVVQTPQGPVMQMSNDKDIKLVSGYQGMLLRDTISNMLTRFGISYDQERLNQQLLNPEVHLANIDKDTLVSLLLAAGIGNAATIIETRETVFASTLSRAFLDGCENIRTPFEVDNKREIPFKKDTWPSDILQGCMPQYIEVTHGQTGHKAMPDNKRMYLSDLLGFDGVDNFFRALAIQSDQIGIFPAWIQDLKRPAMITNCFIRDKQKEGVQIFTPDILKQLERMGITNPEQIAARLGNMFQVTMPGMPNAIIPQGTYQSASRVATLDKMSTLPAPLNVNINDKGLDDDQKAALNALCAGAAMLLLAGPPGTGKSTMISRFIQHLLAAQDEEVVVLTPTGKAASRLNQEFEVEFPSDASPVATTIHAMFYPGRTANHPGFSTYALKPALDSSAVHAFPLRIDRAIQSTTYKDGKNTVIKTPDALHAEMLLPAALAGKTVIIDEASQVTNDLMALIISLRPKRIVLAGDPSQLRPVGAGQPFHDYISAAREGYLQGTLVLAELKTDHRATKELAAFTAELRKGTIPETDVQQFDAAGTDARDVAQYALSHGGSVVETASMQGVSAVIDSVFSELLTREQPYYAFYQNDGFTASVAADTTGFIVPVRMAKELSCQRTAVPDTMVMAHTNAEVHQLNQQIQSYIRPHVQRGNAIQGIAPFAGLISSDLLPGDVLMQTDNARTRVQYATPQGTMQSSRTMNGEAYVFLGANVWLPMPTGSNTSDVDFAVNNAWRGTGILADVQDGLQNGLGADPDFHCAVYQRLSELADNNNQYAINLMRMSLAEVHVIDQMRLRLLGQEAGSVRAIPRELIKHLPILPSIPRSHSGAINNDDSVLGLARRVWRVMEINAFNNNAVQGGIDIDYPTYQRLFDQTTKALSTFASGNSYTVHKAQGSQARTAITVVSPPFSDEDSSTHEQGVYTATTRAQERSIILVHGKTVPQLNKIWSDTRELHAAQESANKAIVRGHLPPLCDTLAMTTTYAPANERFSLKAGNHLDSTMRSYRRRAALASMGLPADIKFNNPSFKLKTAMSSTQPNNGKLVVSSDIPDSGRVAALPITETTVANKRGMVWDTSKSYRNIRDAASKPTDAELNAALEGITGDSEFNFDMF